MKIVETTVEFAVPDWHYCNLEYRGKTYGEVCRFCKKDKSGTTCLLYNMPLAVVGNMVEKTDKCYRATAGFKTEVKMDEPPQSNPRELMKAGAEEAFQLFEAYKKQGYPDRLAKQMAIKALKG